MSEPDGNRVNAADSIWSNITRRIKEAAGRFIFGAREKTVPEPETSFPQQTEKLTAEDITGIDIVMPKANARWFTEYAEREGLSFSAHRDNGEQNFTVRVFYGDFDQAKSICERIEYEANIIDIDNKIESIYAMEGLSEKDKEGIGLLNDVRESLRHSETKWFNAMQNKYSTDKICKGYSFRKTGFDYAMGRLTGGITNKNTERYVCEKTNPDNYISCFGQTDTFKGKDYVKTKYEVFKASEKVLTCHDGRFEGRKEGHWRSIKDKMREVGGFSDDVFIFNNKNDFEQYRQFFSDRKDELRTYGETNYTAIGEYLRGQLESFLDQYDAVIDKNGTLTDMYTGTPLLMFIDNPLQLADISKIIIADKQIKNYENLSRLTVEIKAKEKEILSIALPGEEYKAAALALKRLKRDHNHELAMKSYLESEKISIDAVLAEHATEYERISSGIRDDFLIAEKAAGLRDEKGNMIDSNLVTDVKRDGMMDYIIKIWDRREALKAEIQAANKSQGKAKASHDKDER